MSTDLLVPTAVASLEPFVDAGVFGATEVHLAATLVAAAGRPAAEVVLGAALAARAPLHGSVCIDLRTVADTVVSSLREPVDVAATGTADETPGDDTEFDDDPAYLPPADGADAPPDLEALAWPDPDAWVEVLSSSPLVEVVPAGTRAMASSPGGLLRPLVLDGHRLYLARYWHLERYVSADLLARTDPAAPPGSALAAPGSVVDPDAVEASITRLFQQAADRTGTAVDESQLAAACAVARRNLVVVSGGPGTGKTTTVARLLAGLVTGESAPDGTAVAASERIALVAPTGKAAARMTEAISQAIALLAPDLPAAVADQLSDLEAVTIHRLLGSRGAGFWYGPDHPLPHDLVIVDEVSMVSLSLMAHLLAAIRPDARVVLVGDPYQLASVEAGTVLGDVVGVDGSGGDPVPPAGVAPSVRPLSTVHRQAAGSAILDLAAAIRHGRSDDVMEILDDGDRPEVRWVDAHVADPGNQGADGRIGQGSLFDVGLGTSAADRERTELHLRRLAEVRSEVFAMAVAAVEAAASGLDHPDSVEEALDAIASVKVLCALRAGSAGVERWNRDVDDHLRAVRAITRGDWYAGRPTMVTENDYLNQVFNGDVGVAVPVADRTADGPASDRFRVVFRRAGGNKVVEAVRLDRVVTQWAMSIHKSQGSEFPHAVVVLPPPPARILTRELLYTGVTRAKQRLTLVAGEDAIRAAVDRPVARASGLAERLH